MAAEDNKQIQCNQGLRGCQELYNGNYTEVQIVIICYFIRFVQQPSFCEIDLVHVIYSMTESILSQFIYYYHPLMAYTIVFISSLKREGGERIHCTCARLFCHSIIDSEEYMWLKGVY